MFRSSPWSFSKSIIWVLILPLPLCPLRPISFHTSYFLPWKQKIVMVNPVAMEKRISYMPDGHWSPNRDNLFSGPYRRGPTSRGELGRTKSGRLCRNHCYYPILKISGKEMKIQNRSPKTEFSYWLRLWLAEAESHMAVTASLTFLDVRTCPIYLWSLWHLCSKEASLPLWRLTFSWRLSFVGSWSMGPRRPRSGKPPGVSVVNEVTQWPLRTPFAILLSATQLNTALFLTSLWYLSFWIFNWLLCSFPSAAVTKYDKLGDLTMDIYFPIILEAKFKIKVLTGLCSMFHQIRKDYSRTGMSTFREPVMRHPQI